MARSATLLADVCCCIAQRRKSAIERVSVTEVFTDCACTACGCVCDDLSLHVNNQHIVAVEQACSLAESWLLGLAVEQENSTRIDGASASFADAVTEAARILSQSRAPLIAGFATSSTDGQRAAVQLAKTLRATIDASASRFHAASTLATQNVGASTASLGEVKNRADLIVYWGCDPVESHPRHFSRFVDSAGMFIPGGRADRHVVVIDAEQTATSKLADQFIQVKPGDDFKLITALRSAVKGEVALEKVGDLTNRLMLCQYGAIFYGPGIARQCAPQSTVEALLRLVTELNAHTRCVAQQLGKATGADEVLTWLTGFPLCVNFAQGYPRYNPQEFCANVLLERGEVDSVVFAGSDTICGLSEDAQKRLEQLPVIVLDRTQQNYAFSPSVEFTMAIDGVHRSGTSYRMDHVPIPLRAILPSSLPSDAEILAAIEQALSNES